MYKNHLRGKGCQSAPYLQALALRLTVQNSSLNPPFLLRLPMTTSGHWIVSQFTCPQILKPTVRKTIMRLPLHSSSCLWLLFTSLYFLMRSNALPSASACLLSLQHLHIPSHCYRSPWDSLFPSLPHPSAQLSTSVKSMNTIVFCHYFKTAK